MHTLQDKQTEGTSSPDSIGDARTPGRIFRDLDLFGRESTQGRKLGPQESQQFLEKVKEVCRELQVLCLWRVRREVRETALSSFTHGPVLLARTRDGSHLAEGKLSSRTTTGRRYVLRFKVCIEEADEGDEDTRERAISRVQQAVSETRTRQALYPSSRSNPDVTFWKRSASPHR